MRVSDTGTEAGDDDRDAYTGADRALTAHRVDAVGGDAREATDGAAGRLGELEAGAVAHRDPVAHVAAAGVRFGSVHPHEGEEDESDDEGGEEGDVGFHG